MEPEDNTVTLEEYIKQQKEKAAGLLPKLDDEATRKANEGKDVFQGATVVTKDEEDAYFVGKVCSRRTIGRQKVI